MNKKNLISIGKNLKIKYLTQMNKEEMVDEILNEENGIDFNFSEALASSEKENLRQKKVKSWICEHNKQKYKCIKCGGIHICEHSKQKASCKECKLGRERYILYLQSVIRDYCPFVEAMVCCQSEMICQ